MTSRFFQKTQGLIELLAQDPLRTHVLAFLSRELGPTSEPTAVAFLQLSRDGVLHVVAHEGFAHFDPKEISELNIDSDRASSTALRRGRMEILTRAQRQGYPSDLPLDLKEYWESSVALPIGLQSLYFFNFRDDVTKYEYFSDYMKVIGSLLTNFEWHLREKSGSKHELWYDHAAEVLSTREEQILELIREGKTNLQIADDLGFSESLIRQETVTIYRKLGVTGRKELLSTEKTPKRAARNAIKVAIGLLGIELLSPLVKVLEASQPVLL